MQILRRQKFEMNWLRACHVMADPIGSIGNVHSTQGVWLCMQLKKKSRTLFFYVDGPRNKHVYCKSLLERDFLYWDFSRFHRRCAVHILQLAMLMASFI
jgi:hypothetical protein